MPTAAEVQALDPPLKGAPCRAPWLLRQHPRPRPSRPLMALVRRCRRRVALRQPPPPLLLPLALHAVLPPPPRRPEAPSGMLTSIKAETNNVASLSSLAMCRS